MNVNAAEATPVQPTTVRMVGSLPKEQLQRELNHMLLTIQTAQTNRQMQACTWMTWLAPADLLHDSIATNKAHADKTKGISGHKFGSPHVQSYRAFIAKLISTTEPLCKSQEQTNMLESIKAHLKAYEKNGVDKGWQSIDQFRVRLTKEKTHGIVNYQLSNLLDPQQRYEIETALSIALELIGAEVRPGAPPRSDAERKLQTSIDELRAALGMGDKR